MGYKPSTVSYQSETKLKPKTTWSRAFSRASSSVPGFTASRDKFSFSDWFLSWLILNQRKATLKKIPQEVSLCHGLLTSKVTCV